MRAGRKRGKGLTLVTLGLIAALAAGLAGCGGGSLTDISKKLENPFAKKEKPLPGERIAVITDPTLTELDSAGAGPVSLPQQQANASWSQPGGTPSNNPGHLALSGDVRKVWSADAGTGSSSSGRLSAVPVVADGKVFTLDAAGRVSAFSSASGAKLWATSVTPENEKSKEGFGGGLALDGGRLYVATGYGTVVCLDPRIVTRPYGKLFLESLPECRRIERSMQRSGNAT